MSKRAVLVSITLMLACFSAGIAASTQIQGNAFDYRGKTIEVRKYLDLFTFESVVLDKTQIPKDGSFKFNVDIADTGLYLIKIEKVYAHLFIEPGNAYTLVIPKPIEEDQFNPAKDIFILPEIFESDGKLNYHITEIEKKINQFLIDNSKYYGRSVNRQIQPLADSLILLLNAQYGDHSSAYLRKHLHYKLATLELQTNQSKKKIFETYFEGRDPAYEFLSYSNAFSLFFTEYLEFLNPKKDFRFIESAEKALKSADYQLLYNCLDVDPYLKNDRIKELLLATQLYELGREKRYPQKNILILLDSLIMTAEDTACKIIAANAEQILTRLAPGTLAPDFQFSDVFGNIYRLDEYRGRYIYIQFFDRFDAETLKEMSLMKVLKEGYGTDIAMFSIGMSESPRSLKDFSSKYDFDWYFGKAMDPDQLKDDYDLRALPTYFYLDKDLQFIQSPAPPPGSKIERMFAKVWNEDHPNKAQLFKLQPPEVSAEQEGDETVPE